MNPFNKIPDYCCLDSGPDAYVASAASFHPAGPTSDLRTDLSSSSKTRSARGRSSIRRPTFRAPPAQRQQPARRRGSTDTRLASLVTPAAATSHAGMFVGVYQALSTRNGDEVVSSDQY